jgi:hypothetical protein
MSATTIYGFDSFKSGTSIADLLSARWSIKNDSNNYFSLQSTKGRFGGQSLQWNGGGQVGFITKALGSNLSTLCLHFPWYVTIAASQNNPICWFLDGTTQQITLRYNGSTGTVSIVRGTGSGTVLATSTATLSALTWYVLELKVTFHGSAGVIELRANGTDIIASTGSLNTSNSGNAYANGYAIGGDGTNGGSGFEVQYEHVVCMDDFIGDMRFFTRLPNGTSSTQWTPNASTNLSQIEESQEDGDSTYNASSTPGQVDLFSLPSTPSGLASPFAAMTSIWSRKDDAGTRQVSTQISSSGTALSGATDTLGTSYQEFIDIAYVDPHTSSAWTKSALDALLVGYKEIA